METKASDCEKKKDKQSADLDILRKEEQFWQKAVKILAKNEISEMKDEKSENDNNGVSKHSERVFSVYCRCNKCLTFRQTVVGIYVENCAYNQLWSKLQEIIRSYYVFLPPEQDSVINRKYQELLAESCGIRWFSDGSIDVKKNIHVSMGSYFSISNEMTFMIVFNMLYARDRHQLFELLCLQLTSIILAYREGIKELTRCVDDSNEEYYKPEEFLNYILNGYERITEISETQTPLVIEMRDHLQKFSLTWQLMNQCMYYRFLYVDIESRMADCILRLKDAVDAETYKSFVYRFIKFDEEMTSIGQVWEVALVALELFRKSTPEQVNRVERIGLINKIFSSLTDLKTVPESTEKPLSDQMLALDWIVSSEKDNVWLSVLNSIKNESWNKIRVESCTCWSCLISNGNSVPDICAIPNELKHRDSQKTKANDNCYHLAWCVFKHLKDRKPYTDQYFHPEVFCVFNDPPCQQMECQVATNLIIGSYPLSFTKFLLRTYQPLSPSEREKFLKVPSQSLIRKFCRKKGGAAAKEILQEAEEINHTFLLLNTFWDDDEIADPMLRAGLASALAENFKIDVKFPQKHIIFSYFYALFRSDSSIGDIVLDLDWLEQINLANLFKSFGVISNNLSETHSLNSSNSIEPLEMHLNELKITAEVSAGSNALDLVQFSMKEVADKLSSISLTDDNESAKAVIENEIKKPLVEALKLAASNKKLEAELKSLQKEHNMLKDMVKGLEQIHGEKKEVQVTVTTTTTKPTCSDAQPSKCGHGHSHSHGQNNHSHSGSSSPSISEDHGKDDCVCYYCTLFGKNQDLLTNPRSTEARDRLRKKLHHLQSQKDFSNKSKNLKNISLLLKNGGSSSPKSTAKCTETSENGQKKQANGPIGSMKMKVELELQQRKKKSVIVKPNNGKPEEVKIQSATEINVKSLENLIEYIEGPSSKAVAEQKKAEEVAAKKQLKKLKQHQLKLRRQVELHIEEMRQINTGLQEVNGDIKQVQNQLSQLKAGKGKNKEQRRIKNAEERLAELYAHRKKVEGQIETVICNINTLELGTDIMKECSDMKYVMNIIAPNYTPPAQEQILKPVAQVPVAQKTPVFQPPIPTVIQMQQKTHEDDPAKRMVTIRRVNLPHAEPQVTVTAKGTTPDMDQLLYTFVNGQLVPASNLKTMNLQNANNSVQLTTVTNNKNQQNVESQPKVVSKSKDIVGEDKSKKPEKKDSKKREKSSDNKKKDQVANSKKDSKDVKKKAEGVKKEEPVVNKKEEKPVQTVVKKKIKKAYIDPEFAANPFKLLDDDNDEISDETEEEQYVDVEEPQKKPKEEPKANKSTTSQPSNKNDKNAQKKQKPQQPTMQKGKSMERQDSVTSACSSNNSKDNKQGKKKKGSTNEVPQAFMQSFPLHPQYQPQQPTVYKPADYVKKPVSAPFQSSQQQNMHPNSIMDQLNRGVRVEGLRLPPGITLTKVTPSNDNKRESINRIAQPMQEYSQSTRMPVDEHMMYSQSSRDPNGIIMVESDPHAAHKHHQMQYQANESATGKKKNKKKKNKSDSNDMVGGRTSEQMPQHGDRMVTLKNPMFFNNNAGNASNNNNNCGGSNSAGSNNNNSETMLSMMRNLQTPPFVSPMLDAQQASIIKNENGMYTIRNPAFQSAFSGYGGGNSTYMPPTVASDPGNRQYMPNAFSYENDVQVEQQQPKCNSVIGSEMKNVLQRRKEQEYGAQMDAYGMRSRENPSMTGYSHFGGGGVNFNPNGTAAGCDENFVSRSNNYSAYNASNYDDLRLQPGKMLNSEVTIHNVTESKFFQNQVKAQAPIGTPRSDNSKVFNDLLMQQNLASRPHASGDFNGNDGGMFMQNQGRKSIDIESEERDIEMFKQFDMNYVPPKQKIKCNINMNEIHVNPKKSAVGHVMEEFERKPTSSTNSNSPSSLASSSLDELYEKACYYNTLMTDEKTSSLFSSNGM